MESKHTPGPWKWMDAELNNRLAARLGKKRDKLTKKDGTLLYSLKGPYNGPHEPDGDRWDYKTVMEMAWNSIKGDTVYNSTPSPADRALISAAPDLLAACEDLIGLAVTGAKEAAKGINGGVSEETDDADGLPAGWEIRTRIERARAAIAKARGDA